MEPTSTSTYYIPVFKVIMHYSNTMEALNDISYVSNFGAILILSLSSLVAPLLSFHY